MAIVKSNTLFSDSSDNVESPIKITETRIFGFVVYKSQLFKTNSNSNITFPIDI
jgi:hypothetical protein